MHEERKKGREGERKRGKQRKVKERERGSIFVNSTPAVRHPTATGSYAYLRLLQAAY